VVVSIARLIRRLFSDQRGQDMVEYGGVLLVVALVVAAVVTLATQSLGSTVARDIECLVQKIIGQGGCAAGPSYPVSASVKSVGYDGRVAIVDGGHSYTVTLTKLSDGTARITVLDNGKVGVSGKVGAEVSLGPLGSAGADASIGGGVYGDQTNTWTFPSWSQGQSAFNKISQGNSLGLGAHDAVSSTAGSLPIFGGTITHAFDSVTGASGAPGSGSLPHQYLTASATGGGLQGSGDAGAHVSFGPLQDGVSASLDAHAGLEHIGYGSQNGDWQLVTGLDGTADGELANVLFGNELGAAGNVTGDAKVTFSPSGAPLSLEVTASGDGVWDIAPASHAEVNVPGSEGGSSQGSSGKGGKPAGEGGGEPLLKVESNSSGGSGVGSMFTGELDLSKNSQAVQDIESILSGNSYTIPDLVNQMNSHGTETVQTYQITRSTSSFGASVSAGVGVGVGLNDGSANLTYNRPKTRENGGKWHEGP
jgi:Flp pilus assembly pilin Flp